MADKRTESMVTSVITNWAALGGGVNRDLACTILAALAEVGLLLPLGGETRDERGYWNPDTQEVQTWWSYHDRGYKAPDRVRTVTTWPDGSVLIGPWQSTGDGE